MTSHCTLSIAPRLWSSPRDGQLVPASSDTESRLLARATRYRSGLSSSTSTAGSVAASRSIPAVLRILSVPLRPMTFGCRSYQSTLDGCYPERALHLISSTTQNALQPGPTLFRALLSPGCYWSGRICGLERQANIALWLATGPSCSGGG